jgi:hypothetical protein
LLITSSDGFKVVVSLVSADESATADPANPAPPGLTNIVLRLNEHNVQTDRPAPFVDLVRNLVLVIDSKDLPGITTTKGPMAAFRPYPDCAAWGAKNAPGATNSSGAWVPVVDTSSGQSEHDPKLCQLSLSSLEDHLDLPATIPAGADLTEDIFSGVLPESLPLAAFQLAVATSKSPYTPAIPLR